MAANSGYQYRSWHDQEKSQYGKLHHTRDYTVRKSLDMASCTVLLWPHVFNSNIFQLVHKNSFIMLRSRSPLTINALRASFSLFLTIIHGFSNEIKINFYCIMIQLVNPLRCAWSLGLNYWVSCILKAWKCKYLVRLR